MNGEAVQRLQGELLSLHAQFDLLTSEMALRKELCSQLEVRVQAAEEESCGSAQRLSAALKERREMEDKLLALAEEADSLRLQLQTSKCQLSDVLEMLENLEVAKGKEQRSRLVCLVYDGKKRLEPSAEKLQLWTDSVPYHNAVVHLTLTLLQVAGTSGSSSRRVS